MLTDEGLIEERAHPSGLEGVQRLYRFGDYGLSLINMPTAHGYPFAWEAAVLVFDGKDYEITYKTPLTSDVEVFSTDEETNEFILKARNYFEPQGTRKFKEAIKKIKKDRDAPSS